MLITEPVVAVTPGGMSESMIVNYLILESDLIHKLIKLMNKLVYFVVFF